MEEIQVKYKAANENIDKKWYIVVPMLLQEMEVLQSLQSLKHIP